MQQLSIDFETLPHNGTSTSRRAARSQPREKINGDRQRILDYVTDQGEHGATRWECSQILGIQYATVTARVRWLVQNGKLIDTERTRLTGSGSDAAVLVAPIR